MDSLRRWGFKINKDNKILSNIDELIDFHKIFETKRFDLDYDLDGLVYKINDLNLQKRLVSHLMHQDGNCSQICGRQSFHKNFEY